MLMVSFQTAQMYPLSIFPICIESSKSTFYFCSYQREEVGEDEEDRGGQMQYTDYVLENLQLKLI